MPASFCGWARAPCSGLGTLCGGRHYAGSASWLRGAGEDGWVAAWGQLPRHPGSALFLAGAVAI